jgi:uncharacterized protein involved in type VI secretion and phage assembly
MTDLTELLRAGDADTRGRLHGVVSGVVTNNQDPENLGRVKVRFPWLSAGDESWWARPAVPMAGADAGTYFLPEVNDEVLVAFEHGDVRFPYVLGSLWHAGDEPPKNNAKGKRRMLRSRSGLTITLDDSDGAEQIEISAGSSGPRIVISADGKIVIEADAGVSIKASGGPLTLEGASVKIEAQTKLDLVANGPVSVKGAQLLLG